MKVIKSCQLDPIPTWLLKECIDGLITAITTIINQSSSQSTMPDDLKMAYIIPLLEKLNLLIEILKNYCPFSNFHLKDH